MLKYFVMVCVAVLCVGLGGAHGVEAGNLLIIPEAPSGIEEMEILFEHSTIYEQSRGITYERSRMMTGRGMLDVHVLRVDLGDPYIYLAPVTSSQNLGRRETPTSLLSNAGAVGGINADFFGLAGRYSTHFGVMANDGQFLGGGTYANANYNRLGTFLLDEHNNPFFRYIRTSLRFYNNGAQNVYINAYNNIGHTLNWPVVVSRGAMEDTAHVDSRFPNLVKIVVAQDRIVQVTQPGQTVQVPEHGYVVILPERMAYRARYFRVGDTARFVMENNVMIDYATINTAISGGGLILQHGRIVNDRGMVPGGRHPRSAIGASRCGRYLILMVADGRSHSIGATHEDMAYLMLRAGAHNAMHFDGGGSSTLVTSSPTGGLHVANTLSEGSQRSVINALGVFGGAPVGDLYAIHLAYPVSRAMVGMPVHPHVFGTDALGNMIALDQGDVTITLEDPASGLWEDGAFTPDGPGRHVLEASYGAFDTTAEIYAYVLAEIVPLTANISVFERDTAPLRFTGIATCGTSVPVPTVGSLSVTPAYLGHFENGAFVAARGGVGFVTATIGNVQAHIPVSVGGFPVPVDMFSGTISPLAAPVGNEARVGTATIGGRQSVTMTYAFEESTTTQAAYVVFYPPLEISVLPGLLEDQQPVGLRLQAHGDGSGHWLRGRIQDGLGETHLINFTHNADFFGWEMVTATLPNVPGPFTLDQIYMVALNAPEATNHTVAFYGLEAIFAPTATVELPQSSTFVDPFRAVGTPTGRQYQFAIPREAQYAVRRQSDFTVVTMAARGGGIFSADREQWGRFMEDIQRHDTPYVLVLMDADPTAFRHGMEFELFHYGMAELQRQGRTVFVVSATPGAESLLMQDGVRYINMGAPDEYTQMAIRFWLNNNEVRWG